MDSNFLTAPPLQLDPSLLQLPTVSIRPTSQIADTLGVPEWLVVGAAVGVAALLVLRLVR